VKKYQEPQAVTSQKTPFLLVTARKTSNLTYFGGEGGIFVDKGKRGNFKSPVSAFGLVPAQSIAHPIDITWQSD
jgi:hypothetical protein